MNWEFIFWNYFCQFELVGWFGQSTASNSQRLHKVRTIALNESHIRKNRHNEQQKHQQQQHSEIESIYTLNAQVHFEKYTEVRQIKRVCVFVWMCRCCCCGCCCHLLFFTIKGRTCNKQLEQQQKRASFTCASLRYVNTNATYSQQKSKRLAAFIIKIDYHGICSQAIFLRHENMWAHTHYNGHSVCVCVHLFDFFVQFYGVATSIGPYHLCIRLSVALVN